MTNESELGVADSSLIPPSSVAPVTVAAVNATQVSIVQKIRRGWVRAVGIEQIAGSVPPRGRYYARVLFFPNSGDAASFILANATAILWQGYVQDLSMTSLPHLFVSGRDGLALQLFCGTNAVVGDIFAITVDYEESAGGAPYLFWEAPYTGSGEILQQPFLAPAAGADYSPISIPAGVRRKLLSWAASLVTAAGGGSRGPSIFHELTAGAILWHSATGFVGPSKTTHVAYGRGHVHNYTGGDAAAISGGNDTGTASTSTAGFPFASAPDVWWLPTNKLGSFTPQLQAADAWGTLKICWEEWAGPSP